MDIGPERLEKVRFDSPSGSVVYPEVIAPQVIEFWESVFNAIDAVRSGETLSQQIGIIDRSTQAGRRLDKAARFGFITREFAHKYPNMSVCSNVLYEPQLTVALAEPGHEDATNSLDQALADDIIAVIQRENEQLQAIPGPLVEIVRRPISWQNDAEGRKPNEVVYLAQLEQHDTPGVA